MDKLVNRLLQFTGDGVYRYTWEGGQILLANEGLVKILDLDCTPQDLVGKRLRDLMVYTEKEGTVRRALTDYGEIHGFYYHFKTLKGEEKWVLHDSFVAEDPDTHIRVVDAIVKDVTDKKRAEDDLAAERERLAVTIQSIGDAVIATDEKGTVILLNKVAEQLTGWSESDAIGQTLPTVFHIINEQTRELCEDPVAKVIKTGLIIGLANHTVLIARDGSERIIADSGAPIRARDGTIVGAVLVFRDTTEQRAAERQLRENEALLRSIVTNIPIVLFSVDREGVFTLSEGKGLDALGLRAGDVVGRSVYEVYRDFPQVGEHVRKALAGYSFSAILTVKDISFETWYSPVRDQDGAIMGVLGVAVNITERKRADDALRLSLQEKEVLLKEIHHRVKNNMQVIYSLLSLQAQHTRDPQAIAALVESQNRVRSMALVHEKLYQAHNLARIDFADYVNKLASELLRTYRLTTPNIDLEVRVEPVEMSIDSAIPCGLMINELIANCLKHAFTGDRRGKILVALQIRPGQLVLSVSDNGKGIASEVDVVNPKSLGLQLVSTLARQIDGQLTIEQQDGTGTRVQIIFPFPGAARK